MTKGIIEHISTDDKTAVIALETGRTMQVDLDMLPEGADVDDFVILEKGLLTIDPLNEQNKQAIKDQLNKILKELDY